MTRVISQTCPNGSRTFPACTPDDGRSGGRTRMAPAATARMTATSVAAAVFVKGSTPKVAETEDRLGDRFYSAVRAEVPLFVPNGCPLCARMGPPVPWTALLGEASP